MTIAIHSSEMTAEQLLTAVKQLPLTEQQKFQVGFAKWKEQENGSEDYEAALLAQVEANSGLPDAEQRRYQVLQRKMQEEALSERELAEVQGLTQQLEAMNVRRLETLVALAERRGASLRGLMTEIGMWRE